VCCSVISRMSTPGCAALRRGGLARRPRTRAGSPRFSCPRGATVTSRTTGVLELPRPAVQVQDRAERRCPPISGLGVKGEDLASRVWFDPESQTLLISRPASSGPDSVSVCRKLPQPTRWRQAIGASPHARTMRPKWNWGKFLEVVRPLDALHGVENKRYSNSWHRRNQRRKPCGGNWNGS
jgi:hypothetical protein